MPYHACIIGQLSDNDSIHSYSNSSVLAYGNFLKRLILLHPRLGSDQCNDEILTANEIVSGVLNEGKKICLISGQMLKIVAQDNFVCGDETMPDKTFTVCKICHTAILSGKDKRDIMSKSDGKIKILLCTATDIEDSALLSVAREKGLKNEVMAERNMTLRSFDMLGRYHIYHARSSMGAMGPGGSYITTLEAIRSIHPHYVISCGIAFGLKPEKHKLGDVLVSESVMCYEKGRLQEDKFIPRGQRIASDSRLLQAARIAISEHNIDKNNIFQISSGLLLSGEKLIDDVNFKNHLKSLEPEAIGGEMEGCGVIDACVRQKIGWIVIKGICDWAENKKSGNQNIVANNAFSFVFKMLEMNAVPMPVD